MQSIPWLLVKLRTFTEERSIKGEWRTLSRSSSRDFRERAEAEKTKTQLKMWNVAAAETGAG